MELAVRLGILLVILLVCMRLRSSADRDGEKLHKRVESGIERYGPCTLTFYDRQGEMLLREPSMIALDRESGLTRYVGGEAGRVPEEMEEEVVAGSPFRGGIVADFDIASELLQILFQYTRHNRRGGFPRRPRVAVCAPVEMTNVERTALRECLIKAGAREVLLLEEPFSRAGPGIPARCDVAVEITPEG